MSYFYFLGFPLSDILPFANNSSFVPVATWYGHSEPNGSVSMLIFEECRMTWCRRASKTEFFVEQTRTNEIFMWFPFDAQFFGFPQFRRKKKRTNRKISFRQIGILHYPNKSFYTNKISRMLSMITSRWTFVRKEWTRKRFCIHLTFVEVGR